jgi:hypothetical protein
MKLSSNPCLNHERFEELAALAAVGELSAFELKYLREHLSECLSCRKAYEEFIEVTANHLGATAANREPVASADDIETQESLRLFRAHVERKRPKGPVAVAASDPSTSFDKRSGKEPSKIFLTRAVYGLAAAVLMVTTVAAVTGVRSTRTISAERWHARQLQAAVDSLKQRESEIQASSSTALAHSMDNAQRTQDVLQKTLLSSESRNAELSAREKETEAKLTRAIADAEQLRQQLGAEHADRERLTKLHQDAEDKLREALAELYEARQKDVQVAANKESSEGSPVAAAPASESAAAAPASEVEARSLFGARNLHIVDVYDVTSDKQGNGQKKRTYGRVYYVEKKILVFYAFDLQDHEGFKRGVFQAWGYREANAGKALDLGIFTVDDVSVGRWVLTVNRPDVLSHIDAVFVTAEASGGSTTPHGKRVLYANLAWPANHP